MKRLWAKLVFLVTGILSLVGIQPSWAAPTPSPVPPQVGQVKETTPLYLKLHADRVSEADTNLVYWQHYQHYSHWAHRSHWAHYSHYNYYR